MARRKGRHGDGHIEELPSGSFRATISVAGKPVRKTLPTRKLAADWKAEMLALHARGELAAPSKVTLAEYAAKWCERGAVRWKPSALAFARKQVKHITDQPAGGITLDKLTRAAVEDWLAGLPGSADKKRKALTTLRAVLKAAAEDGLVRGPSPAGKVAKPKRVKKEIRFWTADQTRSVVAAAESSRLGALVVLGLDTGLRVGELLALHWPEVDLDAGTVRVVRTLYEEGGRFELHPPKTPKARRTVALSPVGLAAMKRHRDRMAKEGRDTREGVVFPALRKGGFMSYNVFYQRHFKPIVAAAGVPHVGLHGLRHTNATLHLSAGDWVKAVSDRLGHEDIQTTLQLYAHVIPGDQQKCAATIGRLLSPAEGAGIPRPAGGATDDGPGSDGAGGGPQPGG